MHMDTDPIPGAPARGAAVEYDAILSRLAAVESAQRRWRRFALAAAATALGAAIVGMSAPPTRVVEAQVIRVLDASGKTRMILAAGEDGPSVALLDEKGRLRANLGVSRDGPSLDLLDQSESPRAQLTVDGEQDPHLDFTDAKGVQVTLRP
jgi:hypothetical protein